MRVLAGTLPVSGFPGFTEAHPKKFWSLVEKSDQRIRVKVTTRSTGPPFADALQGEECLDFL